MSDRKQLSKHELRLVEKQRKEAVKQSHKFHKEQSKSAKKALNDKNSKSDTAVKESKRAGKIEQIVNSKAYKDNNFNTNDEYIRKTNRKIENMQPKVHNDGYYVDEYGERQKQLRRANEIKKQQNEKIRRRKKPLTRSQIKRRRILLYSAIFLVVLIIGAILCLTVLFKTERIEITGDKYYTQEQIKGFSNVELQQNIFVASMFSTPEKITSKLPYVESASVNFTIPDTVTIKITNAKPSYVIKNGNSFLLISEKGRILDNITENKDKLPVLTCGKLKSAEIGDYVSFSEDNIPDVLEEVVKSCNDNKFDNITAIDVSDSANIKIKYDDRITIILGIPEEVDYKIRTALTIINDKLDPNNTKTVTGTLDVSSCSSTKMSYYKPGTTVAPTTQKSTTAETTQAVDTQNDTNNYTWDSSNSTDTNSYDTNSYDNTYSDTNNSNSGDNSTDNSSGGYAQNYYAD